MRSAKINGYQGKFESSFLSCEKDTESIIKKLFVDSKPYSDMLKRLLIINTPDCLDDMTNQVYNDKIKQTSVADLSKEGYVRLNPKITMGENEEVKSYIVISFDNFRPNETNPYYRDCTVMIDILCHTDYWDLGNYQMRPIKIVGYIDGILNNAKLSGIGVLNFLTCKRNNLDENLSGYTLIYKAVHDVDGDDKIPSEESSLC